MKAQKLTGIALAALGLALAVVGVSLLRHYAGFTETAEGVVTRVADGGKPVVKFLVHLKENRPGVKVDFQSTSEYQFPINEHTRNLKAGDKVTVYHAPGRLNNEDARFDKDFPRALPLGLLAGAGVLVLVGAMFFFVLGRAPAAPQQPGP
jgi:hypothetical protein